MTRVLIYSSGFDISNPWRVQEEVRRGGVVRRESAPAGWTHPGERQCYKLRGDEEAPLSSRPSAYAAAFLFVALRAARRRIDRRTRRDRIR